MFQLKLVHTIHLKFLIKLLVIGNLIQIHMIGIKDIQF